LIDPFTVTGAKYNGKMGSPQNPTPRTIILRRPLSTLIGAKDKISSPVVLRTVLSLSKYSYETNMKIYENAKHCFDWEGYSEETNWGGKIEYNPEAANTAHRGIQFRHALPERAG
jgi:hypothetical protein